MRADAARNRERILATALAMFSEGGMGVSVEAIAKRAEVGIGTLYRHFPTKDALIAAIVVDRFEQMAAHAEGLAAADDAYAALATALEQLVVEGAVKKDFIEALSGPETLSAAGIVPVKQRFKAALTVLVERAQAAGAVRTDVSATDVMALARGISYVADTEADRMRHLSIILAGLRGRRR